MDQSIRPSEITGGRDQKRPTLKIQEEKGTLTIQTEDLAIQAIFNSPILQATNYIEQVEKYCLRAALSTINLKLDEYDAHYTRIKDKIDELYNTLTYKTINMIQDLLVSMRLLKIQMWREQTAIANGLRTHLYHKNLDPYGFNPSQFDVDITKICEARGSAQESLIEGLSQKLKQHQSQKMQEMFCGKVYQPYLAQNKDRNEVNPSSIYSSLLVQIRLKMQKNDETLLRKHSNIQEEIIKFMQFTTDRNLRAQKIAHSLIKKYNEYSSDNNDFLLYSVTPIAQIHEKKQTIDADQLYINKQHRSELRPAFANRIHKVEFKNIGKIFDPETGNLTEIQYKQPEQCHREWDRYGGIESPNPRISPFDTFSQRKRNNPKEFYQLKEFQKQKYRQQELRLRERDRSQRDKQREKDRILSRKHIRVITIPPAWIELAEHDFPFLYFYAQRRQKENTFWDSKQKELEWMEEVYSVKSEKPQIMPTFRTVEQKNKYEQQIKKQAEALALQKEQAAINFEIKRREEESLRLVRLRRLIQSRTYQKFMVMNKLQLQPPPFCDHHAVSRYGITFNVNFDRSKDLRNIDKFFYYYFKERYFKENEFVKENSDNPIIFLDSSKYNMESSPKIISQYVGSIVKKAECLSFFLIWAQDILVYRLKTSKEGKVGYFEFYPFLTTKNSQKLMYELRRRVPMTVKEDIKQRYCRGSEVERIYNKVEVTHRAIFDRHRELPDLPSSILKGRQLVNQIFESLRNYQ